MPNGLVPVPLTPTSTHQLLQLRHGAPSLKTRLGGLSKKVKDKVPATRATRMLVEKKAVRSVEWSRLVEPQPHPVVTERLGGNTGIYPKELKQ